MVARASHHLELKNCDDGRTVNCNRIGCINPRLGSDIRWNSHRRPMVSGGEPVAYKLPGGLSSFSCDKMLCQRQAKHYSAADIGQHIRRILREQARRDSVPQAEQLCEGPLATVHDQRCNYDSRTPAGCPEHNS